MNSASAKSAGYVQANSVQSQFAALTRDRDQFQADQEAAQRESTRAQERLQRLRQEQAVLMTNIQKAQESLGDLSRKQTMLQQEKSRLHRVKESERKALEDCAAHTTNLARRDEAMTRKYVLDLGKLNDEVASDLEKQIVGRVLRCVSFESVQHVVAENFPASTNKQVFDGKLARMKSSHESLHAEHERNLSVKADFEQIEPLLTERHDVPDSEEANSAPHLDAFYGEEGSLDA
eukprot:scaffold11926_cov126-Cylindrotheca_fusiformis.AAC.10